MPEAKRVTQVRLAVPVDDRGELFEVLRRDSAMFEKFGQVYIVRSRWPGTVRGWHRHAKLWDHFCIVNGAAKFGFVDAKPGGGPQGDPYYITLTDHQPTRLDVPPGVWHGWSSLEPNTLLLSIASEPYCGDNRAEDPDEERLPADSFGAAWEVQAK